jgi:type I restriction enzyme, S subunit
MALSKLGNFIEQVDNRNTKNIFTEKDVRGISTSKVFITSKANLNGVNLSTYKVVNVKEFAYVPDTSRRGEKIGLAYADKEPCLVSSIYTVFKVKDESKLLSRYLMMFFNRSEFDRYARFNSWGSARETFSWEDFCDIELEVPPIEIQKKYVAIYEGLLANLRSYEKGLDDLKLVCDGYIEELRRKYPKIEISKFIKQRNETNSDLKYKLPDVVGVSAEKKIIPTKADASKNDISKFVLVKPNDFIYNPRNGIAVGLNDSSDTKIISWNNTCFYITTEWLGKVNPKFLFIFLCRSEWNRKSKFLSWGSSTEVFPFEAMGETEIPLVPIEKQNEIMEVLERRQMCLKFIATLKHQISSICPILIRGSILDAQGGN